MRGNVVCEGILAIFLILYKPIGASPLGQFLLFRGEGKQVFWPKKGCNAPWAMISKKKERVVFQNTAT
jgi:hypothetical protein